MKKEEIITEKECWLKHLETLKDIGVVPKDLETYEMGFYAGRASTKL